jgi:hypothetical protein
MIPYPGFLLLALQLHACSVDPLDRSVHPSFSTSTDGHRVPRTGLLSRGSDPVRMTASAVQQYGYRSRDPW